MLKVFKPLEILHHEDYAMLDNILFFLVILADDSLVPITPRARQTGV